MTNAAMDLYELLNEFATDSPRRELDVLRWAAKNVDGVGQLSHIADALMMAAYGRADTTTRTETT